MTAHKNKVDSPPFAPPCQNFATGITVVTARAADGRPSASPSIPSTRSRSSRRWCCGASPEACPSPPISRTATTYAINVLAEDQQDLSQRFASRLEDKFAASAFSEGLGGAALLDGCCAASSAATRCAIPVATMWCSSPRSSDSTVPAGAAGLSRGCLSPPRPESR